MSEVLYKTCAEYMNVKYRKSIKTNFIHNYLYLHEVRQIVWCQVHLIKFTDLIGIFSCNGRIRSFS